MKIIVLDTETTCLDRNEVEIWQFSGQCFDTETQSIARFNYNFNTKNAISYAARVRCDITPEEISKFPDFDERVFIKELCLGEDNVYYVAHNAKFDREVIASVLYRAGIKPQLLNNLYNNDLWIDTLRLAKHIYDGTEVKDCSGTNQISFALEYLFHYLHLYDENEMLHFHDARFDVDVTWKLLKYCCQKLNFKLPNDIKEVINKSNSPIMVKRFNFGKYKGELISKVYAEDKGYIKWLIEKSGMFDEGNPNYNEDLMISLEKIIND